MPKKPSDKEIEEAFAQIPDEIPSENMPPAFALPDEAPTEEFRESLGEDEPKEDDEETGQKMIVEEFGYGQPPTTGVGGGEDRIASLLERLLMGQERLADEIAEALKGG
jgi:hypothetical protein